MERSNELEPSQRLGEHRYAQWLSGAYIKWACFSFTGSPRDYVTTGPRREYLRGLEARLKLLALFGDSFSLSDVQTIDSPVIYSLFASSDFNAFLDRHPDFFALVSRPSSDHKVSRNEIATRGLARTQDDRWISDAWPDKAIPKTLSYEILQAGGFDADDWVKDKASPLWRLVSEWPEQEVALIGAIRCLDHFLNNRKALVFRPMGEHSRTMYDVMRESLDNPNVYKKHKVMLEKTFEFINREIQDEQARNYQSVVCEIIEKKLQDEGTRSNELLSIMHTAHHCWSQAVAETVSPRLTSLGDLSNSVNVGFYLNSVTDVLIPSQLSKKGILVPVRSKWAPLFLYWDPGALSWQSVSKLREETVETARGIRHAIVFGDDYEKYEAISRHMRALEKALEMKPPPPAVQSLWIIGSAVIALVKPELKEAVILTGGAVAYAQLLLWLGHKYRVVRTLRKFIGERYLSE